MILPVQSTRAVAPGGTSVVLSVCRMTAGPGKGLLDRQFAAPIEGRLEALEACRPTRNRQGLTRTFAFSSEPAFGVFIARSFGTRPTPLTRTFTISIGLASKALTVFGGMRRVERRPRLRQRFLRDLAVGQGNAQLIALPDITKIACAGEAHLGRRNVVRLELRCEASLHFSKASVELLEIDRAANLKLRLDRSHI